MTDFQLRPMTMADINTVYAIEQQVMIEGWSRKNFIDCLTGNYRCEIGEDSTDIVAYSIVSFVLDECHLINIGVVEHRQRQGVGEYILSTLKATCLQQGISLILLEVRKSNSKAQRFYRQQGFYENGIRPNYYPLQQGKEDALLMVCPLF